MRHSIIAAVFCMFFGTAHAVPVPLSFGGTITAYQTVSGTDTFTDQLGSLSNLNLNGIANLFPDFTPPQFSTPTFYGESGWGDTIALSMIFAGGSLAPSNYSVSACNSGYLCEPGDVFSMKRNSGADTVSAADLMYITAPGGVPTYSFLTFQFEGPNLFGPGPFNSGLTPSALLDMGGLLSGTGTFGQITYMNGQAVSGYKGTFDVTSALPVPEPGMLALFAAGIIGLLLTRLIHRRGRFVAMLAR